MLLLLTVLGQSVPTGPRILTIEIFGDDVLASQSEPILHRHRALAVKRINLVSAAKRTIIYTGRPQVVLQCPLRIARRAVSSVKQLVAHQPCPHFLPHQNSLMEDLTDEAQVKQ